ncbi:type ISP restriction/modification enzyme [Kribbella sp. NPDC026611]|uniref:DEAD/DEAH box helicase n=1 Tax=Kribbella sp. NPDC026611 TaxID=3154911 RepID=UPI0033CF4FA0
MASSIHDILAELRSSALDERDKGDKFERLMQGYFRTDPQWAQQFSDVWLWSEWPGRENRPDTGIDLVAKERDTGDLTAIQCKFYAPETYIQKSHIDSFFTASGRVGFTRRIVVSTSDNWSKNAEEALVDQQIPTQRLDISYLSESTIDWGQYSLATPSIMPTHGPKLLRAHQAKALAAVRDGFDQSDRGKLIMACGTGKTFTSLKIAEDLVGVNGTVLFLVPSISLLSQTLREWMQESSVSLRPFAVCSDARVGRKQTEDMSVVDLAEPATTNAAKLMQRMGRSSAENRMTVIFSTYQSIGAVADAQGKGLPEFDLVVCDEAHRTTGVTVAGEDESAFVRVHDQSFLKGRRRLYMTATPRLYDEGSKTKAAENTAVLASMDDEGLYGPEFHRLGFGDAVEQGLLSDYKVLVLAVDEKAVSAQFQTQLADDNHELNLDDAAKLVGCWNGLSKRNLDQGRLHASRTPMRRAVAFATNIKASKKVAGMFEEVTDKLAADSDDENPLMCEAQHVDGTFNVLERNKLLDWLKADQPEGSNLCRILSNVRCLSEGVDVPALDAVLFLNPRNSVVDVVQSVGRVMRRAPGKEYGYVILPIGVPADMSPEEALADNKKYRVVWQVLQALRAHDDRFNAMVNKIELNRTRDDKLQVIGVPGGDGRDGKPGDDSTQPQLPLSWSSEWRDAIYAKIVTKVGDRRYWEDWAADIAVIAERHITRIKALLDDPQLNVAGHFDKFHAGLKANLNDSISRDNAIEMLAQHIITKPVFDALFEGYDFTANNPVSLVMQDMLDVLDEQGIDKETETLDRFYASVRMRAAGIDNGEGKQKIITELYEKFFKHAFPKAAASLGIVYTPVEIVDFIIRAVEHVLTTEFGTSLTGAGVHVLDPFTGTGTFIVRLLQSGFIKPEDLFHKYVNELHANEISLLAYYVAAVNIEAAFHGMRDEGSARYAPFEGIVLTDTFQMHEDDDTLDQAVFVKNNDRVVLQKATDIRVILSNPPYSVGQASANDDNLNLKYPTLDSRIAASFGAGRNRGGNNAVYDSYIRAIRWAADRVGDQGIVAYVSNGGYIDSNVLDGVRRCLVNEFDTVYVYNLRGNARTVGEQRRKEKDNVFGQGSRTTVAILVLVKTGKKDASEPAALYYRDIGDYFSKEEKLSIVGAGDLETIEWTELTPNEHGDWINQRRGDFDRFTPIGDKLTGRASVFAVYSRGLETGRDAWVYNFSAPALRGNIARTVAAFNKDLSAGKEIDLDATRISWTHSLKRRFERRSPLEVVESAFGEATYRPFMRTNVYYEKGLNHIEGRQRLIFPTVNHQNFGFYVVGMGSAVPFSVLMTAQLPDLHVTGAGSGGQFFPRYTYEAILEGGDLFSGSEDESGYRKIDNVTDFALDEYRSAYGPSVSKDDIFYYVYGLMHSPAYRSEFDADLKKMLPRIPLVKGFERFADAGKQLAYLHMRYESAVPYDLEEIVSALPSSRDFYRVQKMTFGRGASVKDRDRSRVIYNSRVTVAGIPDEAHRYVIGSRSAIEWLMDRYQVRTDKASGIVNDPNDWAIEQGDPRYILDLLKRIVTVSVETMKIVDNLPLLDIIES